MNTKVKLITTICAGILGLCISVYSKPNRQLTDLSITPQKIVSRREATVDPIEGILVNPTHTIKLNEARNRPSFETQNDTKQDSASLADDTLTPQQIQVIRQLEEKFSEQVDTSDISSLIERAQKRMPPDLAEKVKTLPQEVQYLIMLASLLPDRSFSNETAPLQ